MTFREFLDVLAEFNRYSALPGVVFFFFSKKSLNSTSGILFLVILASFLGDFGGYVYAKYVFPNNYGIGNSWHIVNFILLSLFFIKVLPVIRRKVIYIFVTLFIITSIISFGFFYSFLESNTPLWVSSSVFAIILSLLAFLELLKNPSGSLRRLPVFWITTTILVYSAVTLLINLFQQYLVFDLNITMIDFGIISLILLSATVVKNFLFFYSLVLLDRGHPDTITLAQPS